MKENQIAMRDWDADLFATMKKLKMYSTRLQGVLPSDAGGRPLALANPQCILATGLVQPVEQFIDSPPDDCVLPISYLEGLPTIYGVPIWERLEGEKTEYYELFKRYRQLQDTGQRRSIFKLHQETGIPTRSLEVLRQVYNWQLRVEAFDLYMSNEREYALEMRRREVENRHYCTANSLFDTCAKYLQDNVQMLTPKTAIQMLDIATRLERISVGLLPDRPGTTTGEGRPTINIQNNVGSDNASQGNGGAAAGQQAASGNVDEDKQKLKQVLNVMNNIGLFQPPEDKAQVVEVEVTEEGEQDESSTT